MSTRVFKIVDEFSITPSARTAEEGKFPGVELRNMIKPLLQEAIDNDGKLLIDLDEAAGYGTSFLEEVFGGLIRVEGFKYEDIIAHLEIKSDEEPELIEEIMQDIKDAYTEISK